MMAKLGDIATYINGYAFKPQDWSDEGIPIIRIQDLTGNSYQANRYNGEYASKYEVNDGDVLISWSASLGVYIWHGEKAVLNQHIFKVVFDKERISKDFFVHQVGLILENAASDAHGATMKHLTKPVFDALPFYLPPYEKQCEIAEVLDKVTSLISLRKQQLAKLDELVKARFVEMFGDEQAFNKEPLSQNVEEMFIGPFGSSLKNENFVSKENGYCMVYEQKHAIRKTMDVETRYIDKPKYEELKRFSIHGGDIIVSCRGTIGETYIVPLNAPLGIMHPSIMKIRVKDSIYNRVFFDFLLQEKLKQHEAQANGSGVKMAVTASALGKEEFIVPSIPFQNQFAAFVERVDQQKQTVQQSLEKLELMKKALMQEYFG